ncbi:MAG: DUF2207 domain-containing protein [Bacillus sp. (in: Bacteria)]|nr:DUF2207 domain-containing protein [Bacillus sp. (in: firmicutes)]
MNVSIELTGLLWLIFAITSLTVIMIVFFELKRKNKGRELAKVAKIEMDDYFPPLLLQLYKGKGITSDQILAALLSFVRRGHIELTHDDQQGYYFEMKSKEKQQDLSQDERYFMEWLFYEAGTDGKLHPSQFQQYSADRDRFLQKQTELGSLLEQGLIRLGLIKKFQWQGNLILGVISICSLVIGSASLFYFPLWGISFLLLAIISAVLMGLLPRRTVKGWEFFYHLKKLAENLKEDTMEVKKDGFLKGSFIFAVALGLLDDYKKIFPFYDAAQVSIRQENFPLYMSFAPGTFAITKETMDMLEEARDSFEVVQGPEAMGIGEGITGTGDGE